MDCCHAGLAYYITGCQKLPHDYFPGVEWKNRGVSKLAVSRDNTRNFCIIAHIDHGKSTLADRILEKTRAVALRDMEDQLLDSMDLERERGITIKAHAVTVSYDASDGESYIFNLIDTPGHVDFNYEVSRSLAACEGALLVVDASQGIEAQTLANTYLAVEHGLEIVPVINKIDLPSADPERVRHEIEDIIGIDASQAPLISAKQGVGIEEVLEAVVQYIPAPAGEDEQPLQALIFDSYYDSYKGVIVYIRVKEGQLHTGDTIRMMATGAQFDVVELGIMRPGRLEPCDSLKAGQVGYIAASIKTVSEARVGDTVTLADRPADKPLPGYRKVNPMVLRDFSCGRRPLSGFTGGIGAAAAQRRLTDLRAGNLGGSGIWISLRIPGAAAYGNCAGTAGEGV